MHTLYMVIIIIYNVCNIYIYIYTGHVYQEARLVTDPQSQRTSLQSYKTEKHAGGGVTAHLHQRRGCRCLVVTRNYWYNFSITISTAFTISNYGLFSWVKQAALEQHSRTEVACEIF